VKRSRYLPSLTCLILQQKCMFLSITKQDHLESHGRHRHLSYRHLIWKKLASFVTVPLWSEGPAPLPLPSLAHQESKLVHNRKKAWGKGRGGWHVYRVSLSRRNATPEIQNGLAPPHLFKSPKSFLRHQKLNSPSSGVTRSVGVQHAGLYSWTALRSIQSTIKPSLWISKGLRDKLIHSHR